MPPLTQEQREALQRKLADEKAKEEAARYYPSEIYRQGPPPTLRPETQTRQTPPPQRKKGR
jgi:hypothetical protein